MKTIRHEAVGNKELVVIENEGLYTIVAYIDNVVVGSFYTVDKEEAQEVFSANLWTM